jgi:hypothetical protein
VGGSSDVELQEVRSRHSTCEASNVRGGKGVTERRSVSETDETTRRGG